jgi:hypothetical protein
MDEEAYLAIIFCAFIVLFFTVVIILPWATPANNYISTTERIDGGSYYIAVNCSKPAYTNTYSITKILNVTYYTSNQTGVHYFPVTNVSMRKRIVNFEQICLKW